MENNGKMYNGSMIRKVGTFNHHYEVEEGCFKHSFRTIQEAKDFIDRKEKEEQ